MNTKKYFLINKSLFTDNITLVGDPIYLPTTYLNTSGFNELENNNPELLKDLSWLNEPNKGFWEAVYQQEPEKNFYKKNISVYNIDSVNKIVNVNFTVVDLTPQELEERRTQIKNHYSIFRNRYLLDTDFTQLPDAPISSQAKQEFSIFRQQLRDMFDIEDYNQLNWPTKPTSASNVFLPKFEPIIMYPFFQK